MVASAAQTDPFQRFGGLLDRASLSEDSALGAAWWLGDQIVAAARAQFSGRQRGGGLRVDLSPSALSLELGIVQRPLLNAVVSRHGTGYALALFWPLVLTIQGVSAAIWSHPAVAPWIGDVARLRPPVDPRARFPPGFDVFLGLIDAVPLEPARMRSGLRAEHVDSIVDAGEERWDAFLITWNAALRFVWAHELAHVLYGHVDLADAALGAEALFEAGGEDCESGCPSS